MTTAPSGSVAVGVDQSAGARTALERAAAEAELRGLPLRIAGSWNNLDHELPEGYQQQPCTRPPSRPPPGSWAAPYGGGTPR